MLSLALTSALAALAADDVPVRAASLHSITSSARPNARDFAERDVMEYPRLPPQSALMPANLITLPHFSISSAISFPNSAGDPGSARPPRSARRSFILGSASAALTSLLSFSTISAGVAFGAPTPYQVLAS